MATRDGAKVVVAEVPFPIKTKEEIFHSIISCVTDRTKFALIDHVPSRTAVIIPVEELVAALAARGIDTVVDGAHVPGMISLDISKINAAYYVGNCHKWMCTPRGVGFIHIRADRVNRIKPLVIARSPHAANTDAHDSLEHQFDWQGTFDPSAWLSLPASIDFLETLLPGGHAELIRRNKSLAIEAGRLICKRIGCGFLWNDSEELVTSMLSIPLPDSPGPPCTGMLPIQHTLWEKHQIEVPIYAWPAHPKRVLRISAQAYNYIQQYASFAEILYYYLQQETTCLPSSFILAPISSNSCRPICRDSHVRKPTCKKLVKLPSRRKSRPDIEYPGHLDLFRLAKARTVDILRKNKSDPPPLLYPQAERIQEAYFPLDDWLEIGDMELEISRLTYTLSEYRARQIPTFCDGKIEDLLLSSILDNWSDIVEELKSDAKNAYNYLVSTTRTTNSSPANVNTFCRSPIPYSTTPDLALPLWKKAVAEFGEQLQALSFGHVRPFLEIHAFLKDPFTGLFNDFERQTMIFNSLWVEVEREISGHLPRHAWQALAAQLALESSYLAIKSLEKVTYVHFRGHQQLTYVYVNLDNLRRVEFSLPSRVVEVIKEISQLSHGEGCPIAPITISCVISPRTEETYKVVIDGNNRVVALTTLRFLASNQSLETYAAKRNLDLKFQAEIRDVLRELGKSPCLKQFLGKSDVLVKFAMVERIPALVVQEQSFHTAWIEDTEDDGGQCLLLQPVQQVIFSERGTDIALPAKHQSHGRPLGFKAMPLI
jgi:hypothetical protein